MSNTWIQTTCQQVWESVWRFLIFGLIEIIYLFLQSSLSSLSDMESIELLLVVYPSNETQDVAKDLETLHLLSSYKNKHKRLSIR